MMVRTVAAVMVLCILTIGSSTSPVRNLLTLPLVIHDTQARGDVCYVMAGGGAIWERLDAAADLVQMGRVSQILVMQDNAVGQYSFKAKKTWTKTQWMADYLAWRGILPERIHWLPQQEGFLGSLTEARSVSRQLPKQCKNLVVVSSAPHMRRSVLAFERSLPKEVSVLPYAATTIGNSYELHHPIWLEYLKLSVYYVVA